jgi:hypothetical protein
LKYNNKEGQTLIFRERERKEGKKAYRQQIGLPLETRATSTGKEQNNVSNNMVEMYFWIPGGVTRAV